MATKVKRKRKRSGNKVPETTACSPLSHPIRVRILEVVNERRISPVQFVDAGLAGKNFESKQEALSQAAYHFRVLEKSGLVVLDEIIQRRGASEHIYRGTSRVFLDDEEFADLPKDERKMLSKTSAQGLFARTDSAIASGSFDNRLDRHLTYRAMKLDEQGWNDMMESMRESFFEQQRICEEAEARLAEHNDKGAIPVTVGMLGFESPKHNRFLF